MFNRFGTEIRKGMQISYFRLHGDKQTGIVKYIRKVKFPAALGAEVTHRITMDSGLTCLAGDVAAAWWPIYPRIVRGPRINVFYPRTQTRRPYYAWVQGWIVEYTESRASAPVRLGCARALLACAKKVGE